MTPAAKKRLIAQLARQRGLDPGAVLAVASTEGGFGGAIGDGGTSFGPFQLHWGGAMPSQFRGDSKASQRWANSREGITYALDQMVKAGARGLTGQQAINTIVRRFERPADPDSQVAKALGRYSQFRSAGSSNGRTPGSGPGGLGSSPSPAAALASESMQSALASQMLAMAASTVQGQLGDPSSLMGLAMMRQSIAAAEQQFGPVGEPTVPEGAEIRGPSGGLVTPLGTPLTGRSEFGMVDAEGARSKDGKRYHAGKDWFAPAGAGVRAPWAGKVVEVKASRGNSGQVFGGTVKIQRPDGRVFVARHVDPRGVKVGQRVKPGQLVATVSPWRGGSPHAHIEIWKTLSGGYRYENMIDPVRVFGGG
jgi:murein DD-endopeptidase MepM/ murein hydrolase activator NlpD